MTGENKGSWPALFSDYCRRLGWEYDALDQDVKLDLLNCFYLDCIAGKLQRIDLTLEGLKR